MARQWNTREAYGTRRRGSLQNPFNDVCTPIACTHAKKHFDSPINPQDLNKSAINHVSHEKCSHNKNVKKKVLAKEERKY